jgi:5-(carboxyamino)imidazole ribonucleotide synthase
VASAPLWLELEGAANARDVGGLPTVDGRTTRPGVLLRSDNLQDLSPADVTRLVDELGLRTVVDLRSTGEVHLEGPTPLAATKVRHHQFSLIPEWDGEPDAEEVERALERAVEKRAADERAAAERTAQALPTLDMTPAGTDPTDLTGHYVDYVENAGPAIGRALRVLADPAAGTTLVHCAAGKDRTGVVVALALSLVGVTRDAVVADYVASAERIEQIHQRLLSTDAYGPGSRTSRGGHDAQGVSMEAFLDAVDREYGGPHGLALPSASTRRRSPASGCGSSGRHRSPANVRPVAIRGAMGLPVVGMVGGGPAVAHDPPGVHLARPVAAGAGRRHARQRRAGGQRRRRREHTSLDDLRAFAGGCEVVTFDHEHVPGPLVEALEDDGHQVHPGSAALRHAQDKLVMRERLAALGVPVPPFTPVATRRDVEGFAQHVGWPLVLKAATGGYDGKGVWVVEDGAQAQEVLDSGLRILAEQRVPLRRELAAVVAARRTGRARRGRSSRPSVRRHLRRGRRPAAGPVGGAGARGAGHRAAARRRADVVGVLASSCSRPPDGLLVNELAMRPAQQRALDHRGRRTSQFEQHLRAVLDYPLGDTGLTARGSSWRTCSGRRRRPRPRPAAAHALRQDPALKVHLYGKQVRPGRKIGH